jgi:serralysin
MDGGAGNDTFTIDITDINLTGGEDTAIGGAGDDTFNLMGGVSPKNVLSGGEGTDWLALQFGSVLPAPGTNSNAVVDLRSTSIRKVGDYWGSLQLSGIENVATLDGNDLLIGNSSNNTLLASAGDDTLEGGLGNDILDGGTATDIDFARFTGSTGAKVNLNYAGSQDTRYGKDTFVSIEGLIGGSGADSFLGDSASNTLIGNSGNDTLSGGDGFDLLRGSLGNDRLTGGAKTDAFQFDAKLNAKTNMDTITDFKSVEDYIYLSKAIFSKLTASNSVLASKHFRLGTVAKDKNDYLVYDKAKGALYYDADGSGQGAAVKFAQLVKNTSLAYDDFILY